MKYLSLALLFLVGCIGAAAQSQNAAPSVDRADSTGKKMTVSGCISERNGKYILTNSSYPGGIELNSSEDLKAHVGHKIQVTGTSDQSSISANPTNQNDTWNRNSSTTPNSTTSPTTDGVKRDSTMNQDGTARRDDSRNPVTTTPNSTTNANTTATTSNPNTSDTARNPDSTTTNPNGNTAGSNQDNTVKNSASSSSTSGIMLRTTSVKMLSDTCTQ